MVRFVFKDYDMRWDRNYVWEVFLAFSACFVFFLAFFGLRAEQLQVLHMGIHLLPGVVIVFRRFHGRHGPVISCMVGVNVNKVVRL